MRNLIYVSIASLIVFGFPVLSGAADIYRSLGPGNTTALDTGTADSNNLTISSGVATFNNAVPDNVGVGDAIQYDTSGDTTPDAIAFIHGRVSAFVYTVRNAAGAIPGDAAATQDWSMFRAYTTMAVIRQATENTGIAAGLVNFDAGNRNLVSNDENFFVACYNDAIETNPTTWMSWISDATHRIKIYTPYLPSEVGTSQRHQGKWTTSAFRIEVTNNRPLTLRDAYFQVEGLQLFSNNPGTADRIGVYYDTSVNAGGLKLSHCIIKGSGTGAMGGYYGVQIRDNVSSDFYVWNNIIYGFNVTNSTSGGGICMTDTGNSVYVYNNTIYDCKVGIEQLNGTIIAKNNITQLSTDGYSGTFDASSTSNVSDIASDAPGLNPLTGRAYFVEENDAGNLDFHLNPFDTLAKDGGVDLSADANWPFSEDMDRQTRSGSWDCGADEVADEPTATPTSTITKTITETATPTITFTTTPTASISPTATVTPTATQTLVASATNTATITMTLTISATVTVTPTVTTTATSTATQTPTQIQNALADVDLNWKHALAYPNPATDEVRFLMHLKKPADVRVELHNLNGERVASVKASLPAGNGQFVTWDCREVSTGFYIAKIVINGAVREVLKVCVKK
jgi:hypothetical protein